MTILEKIISSKTKELKILKSLNSIKDLENKKLFEKQTFSLKERLELSRHGIIAEHKRKSPSKSVINDNIKLKTVIKGYHKANVCGISVLTGPLLFDWLLSLQFQHRKPQDSLK